MNTVKTIDELREALASTGGKSVGLVPTMGFLHHGHLSLIETAKRECDCVVTSIFVNPLQFGPQEDFATYPRDIERDEHIAKKAGVDILFTPSVDDMYPESPLTTISVSQVTDGMCGGTRPGHFDGVATVVAKLFNLVQPNRAYFGLKDVQQVTVIKQMVKDLNIPVVIVPCPTVRESDGLAMSSRNVHLSAEERKQATVLYQALSLAKEKLRQGEWRTGQEVEKKVYEIISAQPLADVEYVEMRTFPGMKRIEKVEKETYVLAVAVKFGGTRLIDNILI